MTYSLVGLTPYHFEWRWVWVVLYNDVIWNGSGVVFPQEMKVVPQEMMYIFFIK